MTEVALTETWQATACTCGNGEDRGHRLSCAKWVAVLPNHAARSAGYERSE